MLRAPGEQPGLHRLTLDIVARPNLTVCLPNFGQHPFLVGHVGLDGVGNQEIGTAAGGLRQPRQPFLDLGLRYPELPGESQGAAL